MVAGRLSAARAAIASRARSLEICLCLAAGVGLGTATLAAGYRSLGPGPAPVALEAEEPQPPRELRFHHDGTFEDAFCFQLAGVAPPHYGAFAEGFTSGRQDYLISEIALWVTQVGYYGSEPLDLYIWHGGVAGPPGLVLYLSAGRQLQNVPMWPLVAENRLSVSALLPPGDFSVGFWANFSQICCTWFIASDRSGNPGQPWVNVAPGVGFPSGWRHPEILWSPPVRSLGLGATVIPYNLGVPEAPPGEAPVASTWGRIKDLYR